MEDRCKYVASGYIFFSALTKRIMAERRTIHGVKDRSRIDVNDPIEVEYVHHQFPWISSNEIREVIKQHGPDRDAVEAALDTMRTNRQREDE